MIPLNPIRMLDNCLTDMIKSPVDKQDIMQSIMKEEKITVREFLRNYKKVTAKNHILIVSNNGKEEGVYIPYKEWEQEKKKEKRSISIRDAIKGLTFEINDPNLSQNIDKYLYDEWEN